MVSGFTFYDFLGVFAGVGVCHLVLIAPLFLKPSDDKDEVSSRRISVVSYNVWVINDDWKSVRPVLEEEKATVIYLTELHPVIQDRLKSLRNDFHVFNKGTDAILVRRDAGLSPRLVGGAKGDSVAGMVVLLELGQVDLMFFGIHPAAPVDQEAAAKRDRSYKSMGSLIEGLDEMVIVVGDFNATPWSAPFRSLQKRTGLVNSQRGFGLQTTWPSYPDSSFNGLLRIPIDHCLHSPEIRTVDRVVGDAGNSNHNPIRVDLRIPISGK